MKHTLPAPKWNIAVVGRAAVARVMEATVFCEGLASGRMSEGTVRNSVGAATSERKILLPTHQMLLAVGRFETLNYQYEQR